MPRRLLTGFTASLMLVSVPGCAVTTTEQESEPTSTTRPSAPVTTANPSETPTSPPASTGDGAAPGADEILGTIVRFTSDRTSVDVTIGEDSPAVLDFVSMLPLELSLEEYAGREKIAYPPRELETEGSPGSDPEDGDFIYYMPWGNLAFYYNAEGIGYSDSTIHIGTYSATEEQLSLLEGGGVTVQVVD